MGFWSCTITVADSEQYFPLHLNTISGRKEDRTILENVKQNWDGDISGYANTIKSINFAI